MSPLTSFAPKSYVNIQKINGNKMVKKRLTGIGIVENSNAEILQSSDNHSLILIKIGNRRIAIRRKTGENIFAKHI